MSATSDESMLLPGLVVEDRCARVCFGWEFVEVDRSVPPGDNTQAVHTRQRDRRYRGSSGAGGALDAYGRVAKRPTAGSRLLLLVLRCGWCLVLCTQQRRLLLLLWWCDGGDGFDAHGFIVSIAGCSWPDL